MQLNDFKNVCELSNGNGFAVYTLSEVLADGFDERSPHLHSYYEIVWFREGTGHHTVDFTMYDVTPNTVFFLSPGQLHCYDDAARYEGVCLKMCADFMENEDGDNSLFLKYNVFHTFDTSPCYHIDDATAATIVPLVAAMREEADRAGEFGNLDILQALLRILLVTIQRNGTKEGVAHPGLLKPSHLLFIQFRRMVEREYMHLHTVQEYAARLNVAPRTLNKYVNAYSHMSPLAFINRRIVLEAQRLIRYTNLMIKEIAARLGYEDTSYFVKFFKHQTGYLPSEFREQNDGGSSSR